MLSIVMMLAAPAQAADWSSLVETLIAETDAESRQAQLTAELLAHATDPDGAARVASATQVLQALDATGRTDPSILRAFLTAAVSSDPALRAQAVSQSRIGGDPPGLLGGAPLALPALPEPAAAPEIDPIALRTYAGERLFRDRLNIQLTDIYVAQGNAWASNLQLSTWGVYDGQGTLYGARAFAEQVGDDAGLVALHKRRRTTLAAEWVTTGAGISMMIGGAAMTLSDTDRRWAGTGLTIVGSIPVLIGLGFLQKELRFGDLVSRRYAPEVTDQWIQSHNAALQSELGLSDRDALDIELQ